MKTFSEVIHYKVRIDIARKYFREAIQNGKWTTDDCPKAYRNLRMGTLNFFL